MIKTEFRRLEMRFAMFTKKTPLTPTPKRLTIDKTLGEGSVS
jgi:hypothetical protein